MVSDHLLRFRRKTTEWLESRLSELEDQETIFVSQSMGDTSMQRDLRLLQDQINAIERVLQERGMKGNQFVGVTDFSQINGGRN